MQRWYKTAHVLEKFPVWIWEDILENLKQPLRAKWISAHLMQFICYKNTVLFWSQILGLLERVPELGLNEVLDSVEAFNALGDLMSLLGVSRFDLTSCSL